MLIETTAHELRMALDEVKPAINRRSTIPVLGTVLLEAGAVTATDLDLEIRVKFAASRFEGTCAVPFRQLFELVSSLPADKAVRLKDAGDYGVLLFFEGGRYRLPSYPACDFPVWNADDAMTEVAAPDGLRAALEACRDFVSTEETRYYLNGVCFSKNRDGNSVLVATDGHRLIAHDYDHDIDTNLILPAMALPALLRLPEPEAVLSSGKHMEFLIPGGGRVRTKLIDADYPNWLRVVPETPPDTKRLTFAPLEMMAVLNRIQKLVGSRGVCVDLCANADGDLVVVTANGVDTEECAERLSSGTAKGWEGPSEHRSYKARYLWQICRLHRHAERISIIAADAGAPARIVPEDTKALSILMPMRGGGALGRKALMTFAGSANDADAAERAA